MAVVAGLAVYAWRPILEGLLPAKIAQIGSVALAMGAGAAIYFGLTFLLRAPELHEIKSALRGK